MPYKREPKPTIDDLAEGHAASPAHDGDAEGHAIRAGRGIRPGRDATPADDGDAEGHAIRSGRAPRNAAGDGVVAPAGEGDGRA